jgi:hypothetical protein
MERPRSLSPVHLSIAVDQAQAIYISTTLYSSSGSYINFGTTGYSTIGASSVFLGIINSVGEPIWAKNIGSDSTALNFKSLTLSGTSLYICYKKQISGSSDIFHYVVRFDLSGIEIWTKYFGNGTEMGPPAIAPASDGGIFLAHDFQGTVITDDDSIAVSNGAQGHALSKLDEDGHIVWSKCFAKSIFDENYSTGVTLIATDKMDNIYIAGKYYGNLSYDSTYVSSGYNQSSAYFVKCDSIGEMEWMKALSDYFYSSDICVDNIGNGYLSGFTYNGFNIRGDTIINLTNTSAVIISPQHIEYTGMREPLPATAKLSPNPFSQTATLKTETPLQQAQLTLYDLTGREWINQKNLRGNEVTINGAGLPDGMYFYRLIDKGALVASGKVVVAH